MERLNFPVALYYNMCEFTKKESINPSSDRKVSMYGFSVCNNFRNHDYEKENLMKSIKYERFAPDREVSPCHLREGNVLWIEFSKKEIKTPYYVSFLDVEKVNYCFGDIEGKLILKPFDKRAKSFATKIYCKKKENGNRNYIKYNDGYYCDESNMEREKRFIDYWRNGGGDNRPNRMIPVPDLDLCKSFSVGEENFVHLMI